MKRFIALSLLVLHSTVSYGQQHLPKKGYRAVMTTKDSKLRIAVTDEGVIYCSVYNGIWGKPTKRTFPYDSGLNPIYKRTYYQMDNGEYVSISTNGYFRWSSDLGASYHTRVKFKQYDEFPVYRSEDGLRNYMFTNKSTGFIWYDSGKIYKTYNGGKDFINLVYLDALFKDYTHEIVTLHFINNKVGFCIGYRRVNQMDSAETFIYLSKNGGGLWEELVVPNHYQGVFFNQKPSFYSDGTTLWIHVKGDEYTIHTNNLGESWSITESKKPFIYLP